MTFEVRVLVAEFASAMDFFLSEASGKRSSIFIRAYRSAFNP